MILTWHHIAPQKGFITTAKDDFFSQLALVSTHYVIVSFAEYLSCIQQHGNSKNLAVLTFDDGFQSFAEYAIPILEEFDFPVTNFIPTGHIGGFNEWDSHLNRMQIPLMSETELRDISRHPLVTLGSHGVSHTSFGWLSETQMRSELQDSRARLETITGKPIKYFAFPYGQTIDMPLSAKGLIKEAGYEAAVTVRPGNQNLPGDIYSLRRINVESHDTAESVLAKCRGNSGKLRLWTKEMIWKLKLGGKPSGKKPQ